LYLPHTTLAYQLRYGIKKKYTLIEGSKIVLVEFIAALVDNKAEKKHTKITLQINKTT
jgi:hypothetical protein